MQEKNRFFKLLKVDIVSSLRAVAGLLLRNIWLLYLRDNPAVELMIYWLQFGRYIYLYIYI